jgi:hypothetical protein
MEMLFWAAIRTGPEGCDPISGPGSLLTSDGAINSAPKEPSWLSLSLTLRLTAGEQGLAHFCVGSPKVCACKSEDLSPSSGGGSFGQDEDLHAP